MGEGGERNNSCGPVSAHTLFFFLSFICFFFLSLAHTHAHAHTHTQTPMIHVGDRERAAEINPEAANQRANHVRVTYWNKTERK